MGTLGNWYNFATTFAEAEERSPWTPFHVQGYKPTDSVVSIFFGGRYTTSGHGPRATWKEKFIQCITAGDHNQPPLIVMDPIVARLFVDRFDTKEKLIEWCAENAKSDGARILGRSVGVQTLTHPLAVPASSRSPRNSGPTRMIS